MSPSRIDPPAVDVTGRLELCRETADIGADELQLSPSSQPWNTRLDYTFQAMEQTGFYTWGFVVYRCTYSDDVAWERYLTHMKNVVAQAVGFDGEGVLVAQFLEWTVIENRDSLDGASKRHVRKQFSEWTDERTVKRDGPGATDPRLQDMSRFKFCIYVDQKCLETLETCRLESQVHRFAVCVILDEACLSIDEGTEGCTMYYHGWMYAALHTIPRLYENLTVMELTDDMGKYTRPPFVYSIIDEGMQMPL